MRRVLPGAQRSGYRPNDAKWVFRSTTARVSYQTYTRTNEQRREKETNPSNDIQHDLEQRVSPRRASPRRGLEKTRNQICSDMEIAVLDAFEETLGSLLCSQSFVRGLDLARDGRLGLILLIETRRVHRGREENMGGDTVEDALGAKAFC
jgi:hypothetical protein